MAERKWHRLRLWRSRDH